MKSFKTILQNQSKQALFANQIQILKFVYTAYWTYLFWFRYFLEYLWAVYSFSLCIIHASILLIKQCHVLNTKVVLHTTSLWDAKPILSALNQAGGFQLSGRTRRRKSPAVTEHIISKSIESLDKSETNVYRKISM